jgi:putative phosphoribosyl transferase
MTAALEAMDGAAVLQPPLWLDRHQAGCALAACCCLGQSPAARRGLASPLLLALPRGGVAVAAPMARRLGMPLATWSVRKVADPADPEVAIGAVAPGGVILWRPGAGPPAAVRQGWLAAEQRELERRRRCFADPDPGSLRGRRLLVVDDGIATGMTLEAALLSLRRLGPAGLELAVPVADRRLLAHLRPLVDRATVLAVVDGLQAVGPWYRHFPQLSDGEVLELLAAAGA